MGQYSLFRYYKGQLPQPLVTPMDKKNSRGERESVFPPKKEWEEEKEKRVAMYIVFLLS